MIEPITITGIGAITVLQLANLWQGKRTAQKVDAMVTKEQHDKDISEFKNQCDERRTNIKEDIKHTNIRIMNHAHNGTNVKITKV